MAFIVVIVVVISIIMIIVRIIVDHYNDYNDQFGKVEKSTLPNFMSIYVVSHCHDYKNHHLDQNIPSQETSFWSPTDKNTSRPVLKINFVIGKEESGRKGSERTIIRKNGMRRKIMTEKEEQEETFHFTGMQVWGNLVTVALCQESRATLEMLLEKGEICKNVWKHNCPKKSRWPT